MKNMERLTDHRDPSEFQFTNDYIKTEKEFLNTRSQPVISLAQKGEDKYCSEEAIELAFKAGIEIGRCVERG